RERGRIRNGNSHGFSNFKVSHFANRNPFACCLAKNRRDDKTDEGNPKDSRAYSAEPDAEFFQETPASNLFWRERTFWRWMISGDLVHGEFRRSIRQMTPRKDRCPPRGLPRR